MPGHLTRLSGEMVHPRGRMEPELGFDHGRVRGRITLPAGLYVAFRYAGKTAALHPGPQSIDL